MIVKAVLVTSCQGALKPNHGPARSHRTIAPNAMDRTGERLVNRAAACERAR